MWLLRERFAEIDMGVPSSRTARSSGIPIARVPSSRSMQRCNDATDNASRRVRRMLASRLAAGLFVIEGITSSADCVYPSARRQALLVSTTGRAPVTVTELSNRPNSWTMMWIVRVWGLWFLAIRWGLRDAAVLRFAALRALIGMMGVVNVTSAFGAMFAGVPGLSTDAASVLANAQQLLILLPAWWFYGGSLSLRTAISSAVGFSGSLLVGLSSGGGTGAALSFLAAPGFIASTLLARRLRRSGLLMVSTWKGSSQVPPGCARRLDILSPGCQYCRVKALA